MSNAELLMEILKELKSINKQLQNIANISKTKSSSKSRNNKFGKKNEKLDIKVIDSKGDEIKI